MASLATAMDMYMSPGADNRTARASAFPLLTLTRALQPGAMQKVSSDAMSPIQQIRATMSSMVAAIRGINDENNRQRVVLDRMRRNAAEDARERAILAEPIGTEGAPERVTEEDPNAGSRMGMGQIAAAIAAIALAARKIMRVMSRIGSALMTMSRLAARATLALATSRGALLRGISMIMSNPRLRLLAGVAAGVGAGVGAAVTMLTRPSSEAEGAPTQPSAASTAPPGTAPPGSSQRVPADGAPIPSNSALPINYPAYAQQIGQRESGGNYQAVNRIGYLGKYQFGAPALQDMGLVRSGTTMRGLDDPSNWTIEGGKQAFLNNPQLQEDTMVRYTNQNFRALNRLGVVNNQSSNEQIAGFLAAAHLLGPGGARNLAQGRDGADAFGTSGSSYYRLGTATQIARATSTQASATPSDSTQIASAANAPQTTSSIQNNEAQQARQAPAPVTGTSQRPPGQPEQAQQAPVPIAGTPQAAPSPAPQSTPPPAGRPGPETARAPSREAMQVAAAGEVGEGATMTYIQPVVIYNTIGVA